jgi:hypothetical protein
MKSTIFWDRTQCSPLKINQRFGGTYCLHLLCFPPSLTLISCSAYSSALKMEAIFSSETSVEFQRTTRRYIPKIDLFGFYFVSLPFQVTCLLLCNWGLTPCVCSFRRFTPEQRRDAAWVFAKSHESYATNYDIVFPHDEHLAGRNFHQGPFHQVGVIILLQIYVCVRERMHRCGESAS